MGPAGWAKPKPKRKPQTDGAEILFWQLEALQAHTGWQREYRFHNKRLWRLDLCNPEKRLAVEVEGLGHYGTKSRHQRADGFAADCEKYAELAIAGYRLIRVTSRQIKSGRALAWIERALNPLSTESRHEATDTDPQ